MPSDGGVTEVDSGRDQVDRHMAHVTLRQTDDDAVEVHAAGAGEPGTTADLTSALTTIAAIHEEALANIAALAELWPQLQWDAHSACDPREFSRAEPIGSSSSSLVRQRPERGRRTCVSA